MLEEKIDNIVVPAPTPWLSTAGCLLQIKRRSRRARLNNIQVKHTAQILVEKREKQ